MRRLLIGTLLLTVACSGGGSTSAKSTPGPCVAVSQAMLDGIASGAEKSVGTVKLSRGEAVKSPDFDKVYFIAAHLSAPGVKDEVAVWSSNSLAPGGGLILAVDGYAQQFTVWPDADKSSAKISKADPSVGRAKNCT